MTLDLKKLFPNTKFSTVEELKTKEDSFSIGDRVKVADNIRCIQHGQTGTIVRIDPEDKHGWKSFIVKFDDEKYGAMGFNSGDIDKIDERETTMKRINENTKVTLTISQLKRLIKESAIDGDLKDKNTKKTYLVDVMKIKKYGGQGWYHKKVLAVDLKDALIKLKLGLKKFGEGGRFISAVWVDDDGQHHPAGTNDMRTGTVSIIGNDGEHIPVDTGDLE